MPTECAIDRLIVETKIDIPVTPSCFVKHSR